MDEEGTNVGFLFRTIQQCCLTKQMLHLLNMRGLVRDSIMLLSTCFQARTVCKYGFVLKMLYHVVSQTVLSLQFLLNVLAFK